MTKTQIRKEMRKINNLIQLQPLDTKEQRKIFHELQRQYNKLSELFFKTVYKH